MSNKFELLSGPAIDATLKEADATVYRYELNRAGFNMALGIAVFFFLVGGLLYWQTGLKGLWTVVFVAAMAAGSGFGVIAAYWHQFANEHLVGIGKDRLFVGGPKATWAIAWELLDRRAMGFEEMQMTRLRGALQLQVGGQDIKLHLFNPLVFLKDIEGFMLGVLTNLQLSDDTEHAAALTDEEE